MVPSTANADRRSARRAGRGGRPKASEVERRNEDIVRTAGDMFMRLGFDGTSMEAVAQTARISKRTLYARYPDKSTLFSEVLGDLVRRWLVPLDRFDSEQDNLEDILLALARHLTASSLTPESVSVNRVIIFESQRRPEIGQLPIVRCDSYTTHLDPSGMRSTALHCRSLIWGNCRQIQVPFSPQYSAQARLHDGSR